MIIRSMQWIVLGGLLQIILIGGVLFSLPGIIHEGVLSFVDSMFMATSAASVTGLHVVSYQQLTFLGKLVLLSLIQIGSIGLPTLVLIVMLHSARGGLQWYALATYLLDIGNITRIKTLLRFMCFLTCAIESLGMIFFKILSYCYDSQASLFDCLFQSVNFFSNAGFVFSDHPLYAVTFSLGGLAISSILILLGSLGFLCMLELKEFYDAKKNGGIYIFSVTSKTAFIIYGLTLLLAAVLCYFFVVSDGSLFYRLIKALFYALSMRSCGFIEVSLISKFSEIGLCLLSLYSFLGGVPFSTTSGIKSSVMGIIFATGKSILNAARSVSLFGRSIALECVVKANFYLIYLGFLTYFLSSLLFLLSSSTFSYGQSFLSIGSVLSNTGMLCVNILHADPLMKCILMLGMCIGRLGMLIFILRFSYASQTSIEYPQEKLILV